MSKAVKTIASIALPIAGAVVGGPAGAAIGGAIGGGINGGLKGAVLGGLTSYASAGALAGLGGVTAGAPLASATGIAGLQGPTAGSGILGAVTGGGIKALGAGISSAASGALTGGSLTGLLPIANQLMAQSSADDAKKAAAKQAAAIDRATATQAPYNELGTNAAAQIQQIQADPGAYVQNNPFYKSLADDAQRRLLANQAAKGKVGSGGTQAALQDQLLQLGNGLVQQQVGTLQNQVNSGQAAATNTSNLQTTKGDAQASGVVGAGNALTTGYQNQINTLLALQSLNKTPAYAPTAGIRA